MVIRFPADNPGTWLFHCHVEFHAESGMALLVKVGNKSDLPPEPVDWPRCASFFNKKKNIENEVSTKNESIRKIYLNKSLTSTFLYFALFLVFIIFD